MPRGRGAAINPANRFEPIRLHVLGEHLDEIAAEWPDGVQRVTQVYEDRTRTILSHNDSPDIGFEWSVNPYRGCEHGCIYCYARPGHEYLSLSLGVDFETKIFAKRNAATLLREALLKPSWQGDAIVFSGVTDPYQPIETKLRITRACLEVCAEMGQPVSIITKSRLVLRDLDLLSQLAAHNAARVSVSITTLDPKLARVMEPRASTPGVRLETVRRLRDAGIPVRVMTAPIIPGLNDHEIPSLLKAVKDAGAGGANYVLLRLPYQIKDIFFDWVRRHYPERASRIESAIRDTRAGGLYESGFFTRQRGSGVLAESIGQTYRVFAGRYGLDGRMKPQSNEEFLRRRDDRKNGGQMGLFADPNGC